MFDIFVASKGFWAQALGVGDFYYEVHISNIVYMLYVIQGICKKVYVIGIYNIGICIIGMCN